METIYQLFQYLIHIDTTLVALISTYGNWVYLALFAVIFCETGLVVTPFLPGDSLLFAAGSLAAQQGSGLQIQLLFVSLCIAATLGNKVNYLIGRLIGPRVFTAKDSWLLNKRHLQEAHAFYEKHGGKTIIFARFLPIIRTFVPFVAGVGGMSLSKFSFYNMISGVLWIGSLLYAGFFFGSIPLIKNNFTIVIYAIIVISLLPVAFAVISRKLSPNS
jgi:membrane-associated protein